MRSRALRVVDGACLLAFGLAGLAVLSAVPRAQTMGEGPPGALRTLLRTSDGDLASLAQGRPLVRSLPSSDKREVVTAGAVRIAAPPAAFITRLRTLEGYRTSEFMKQIARFGDRPEPTDLDALAVESEDVEAWRECRPRSCDVQLPDADIERLRNGVDWRATGAPARATAIYKSMLFGYLDAYREGGLSRLAAYGDQDEPLDLGAELRTLLSASPSALDGVPAFREYITEFPRRSLPRTEDFFYWSKEVFGFKPVIGLYHVSIHTTPADETFIVTTQIYASHYMDGQVAVNVVLPDRGAAFYWLYYNRARIGRLDGFIGTLSRSIVQRRARGGLTRSLTQTRQRMEGTGK